MKYINKTSAPDQFQEWLVLKNDDWSPTWKGLAGEPKVALREKLLEDQGWIGCYCGMRVGARHNDCHIEHIRPRETYGTEALEFDNLLVSCMGHSDKRQVPEHCGHKKGNWYDRELFVAPTEPRCETCFRFSADGTVKPTDHELSHEAARETIDRLALNTTRLCNLREAAIEPIIEVLDDLSKDEAAAMCQALEQRDGDGQFDPFCIVTVKFLSELFAL